MISTDSWHVIVNKCVLGCCSNYHEKTIVPACSFPTKHKNLKNKRVRFVKDRQQNIILFVCVSHFEENFFDNGKKVKRAKLINLIKPVPSVYINSIQNSAPPKISLNRESQVSGYSRKRWIFFSIWVLFHEHSRITGLHRKGEGIPLTPHCNFHWLHRHLDISRAITAESSPLHIASSRTRTGNLLFPSASR